MSEYNTQWVCEDCFILLVDGDVFPDLPQEQADALLTKFEGFRAMPGMSYSEHQDGCYLKIKGEQPTDCNYECDCEDDPYSTSACDGCGSPLHGARHAVTIEPVEPQHADYPHEPGTLYDCPACENTCYCTPGYTLCVCCAIEKESMAHSENV